jgi:hypothetical protein
MKRVPVIYYHKYRALLDDKDMLVMTLRTMSDQGLEFNLGRHVENLMRRNGDSEDIMAIIQMYNEEIAKRKKLHETSSS